MGSPSEGQIEDVKQRTGMVNLYATEQRCKVIELVVAAEANELEIRFAQAGRVAAFTVPLPPDAAYFSRVAGGFYREI